MHVLNLNENTELLRIPTPKPDAGIDEVPNLGWEGKGEVGQLCLAFELQGSGSDCLAGPHASPKLKLGPDRGTTEPESLSCELKTPSARSRQAKVKEWEEKREDMKKASLPSTLCHSKLRQVIWGPE